MKTVALFLLLVIGLIFHLPPAFAFDQRADDLLRQAREAIGGVDSLQKIQSLYIKGQYRRVLGDREMAGDREISIMLPDKYLAEDSFSQGGLSTAVTITRGLNGEKAWNGTSGGMGGGIIFKMGAPGGQQATPEQMEAIFRKQNGLEYARYLLSTLLTPPPSLTVQYTYAGESDVEDSHAEVIDVSGPDNFAVRLFFDKQTHLPLLLSYRARKPRIFTAFAKSTDSHSRSEDVKKAREGAEKKLAAEGEQKPEEVDFFIRLTEYKKVGGVLLPHKLTFLIESEVSEEFDVTKYQLNPTFKADKFQKN